MAAKLKFNPSDRDPLTYDQPEHAKRAEAAFGFTTNIKADSFPICKAALDGASRRANMAANLPTQVEKVRQHMDANPSEGRSAHVAKSVCDMLENPVLREALGEVARRQIRNG